MYAVGILIHPQVMDSLEHHLSFEELDDYVQLSREDGRCRLGVAVQGTIISGEILATISSAIKQSVASVPEGEPVDLVISLESNSISNEIMDKFDIDEKCFDKIRINLNYNYLNFFTISKINYLNLSNNFITTENAIHLIESLSPPAVLDLSMNLITVDELLASVGERVQLEEVELENCEKIVLLDNVWNQRPTEDFRVNSVEGLIDSVKSIVGDHPPADVYESPSGETGKLLDGIREASWRSVSPPPQSAGQNLLNMLQRKNNLSSPPPSVAPAVQSLFDAAKRSQVPIEWSTVSVPLRVITPAGLAPICGLDLRVVEKGYLVVRVSPSPGQPLREGDIITHIEGAPLGDSPRAVFGKRLRDGAILTVSRPSTLPPDSAVTDPTLQVERRMDFGLLLTGAGLEWQKLTDKIPLAVQQANHLCQGLGIEGALRTEVSGPILVMKGPHGNVDSAMRQFCDVVQKWAVVQRTQRVSAQ
jgi:hypothetical protein